MSLHKLAEVTIVVYGLPEHCGTDDALQELTEEVEALMEPGDFKYLLNELLFERFPRLADKVKIDVKAVYQ